MNGLVSMRLLIRNPEARSRNTDVSEIPRRAWPDGTFERIVAISAPPGSVVAIALPLQLLGVKSIRECIRAAPSVDGFDVRYTRRLGALRGVNSAMSRFSPYASDMGLVYGLSGATKNMLPAPDRWRPVERVARPLSLVRRGSYSRPSITPRATSPIYLRNPLLRPRWRVGSTPREYRV